MNFSAVILAGGKSSRMGRDKAFLPYQGSPLIGRALDIVRGAGADEVLISGRAGQDFSATSCPVLLDLVPDCGPLGGIERALSVAKHPLVLVLAVDLPYMTPEFLRWLAARCSEATGAVPILSEQAEPLAAFYPKQARSILTRLMEAGQFGARGFVQSCVLEKLVCRAAVSQKYGACFANWNTRKDMAEG